MVMLPERIQAKIEPEPNSGCWLWNSARKASGHGQVHLGGKTRAAHRVVYELLVGPVPRGLELDHLCRTPECVNPDHLEPVTHAENMGRGRLGKLYLVCKYGHAMTEENTYRFKAQRRCRACLLARQRDVRRSGYYSASAVAARNAGK